MRDLLIAADLVHVIRGGGGGGGHAAASASFIGQEKVADTGALLAARGMQQVGLSRPAPSQSIMAHGSSLHFLLILATPPPPTNER